MAIAHLGTSGGRNPKVSEDGVRQILEKKEGLFRTLATLASPVVFLGGAGVFSFLGKYEHQWHRNSTYVYITYWCRLYYIYIHMWHAWNTCKHIYVKVDIQVSIGFRWRAWPCCWDGLFSPVPWDGLVWMQKGGWSSIHLHRDYPFGKKENTWKNWFNHG